MKWYQTQFNTLTHTNTNSNQKWWKTIEICYCGSKRVFERCSINLNCTVVAPLSHIGYWLIKGSTLDALIKHNFHKLSFWNRRNSINIPYLVLIPSFRPRELLLPHISLGLTTKIICVQDWCRCFGFISITKHVPNFSEIYFQ